MKNSKLNLQSKYQSQISFDDLSSTNDILISYYLPIIHADGFSLYSALMVDARNPMINTVYVSVDRIVSMINLSVEKINETISKLELLNLLDVYKNGDNIIFVLKKPLSPTEFNNSEQFKMLLEASAGNENLIISNKLFNSLKTSDVLEEQKITEKLNLSTRVDGLKAKLNVDFDFDSIKNILNARKLDWSLYWSDELEDEILNLIVIYKISSFDIAVAIIELVESNKFSIRNLIEKIRKDYQLQTDITSIVNLGDKTTEIKLDYISQLKTRDYFIHRLDRVPTSIEEKMISTLTSKYNFDEHKINLLVDYSIIVNEGVVNVNYINKIAETIVKEKLDTPEKIVKHLKVSYKAKEIKEKGSDEQWNKPSELDIVFD